MTDRLRGREGGGCGKRLYLRAEIHETIAKTKRAGNALVCPGFTASPYAGGGGGGGVITSSVLRTCRQGVGEEEKHMDPHDIQCQPQETKLNHAVCGLTGWNGSLAPWGVPGSCGGASGQRLRCWGVEGRAERRVG